MFVADTQDGIGGPQPSEKCCSLVSPGVLGACWGAWGRLAGGQHRLDFGVLTACLERNPNLEHINVHGSLGPSPSHHAVYSLCPIFCDSGSGRPTSSALGQGPISAFWSPCLLLCSCDPQLSAVLGTPAAPTRGAGSLQGVCGGCAWAGCTSCSHMEMQE